MKKMKTNVLKTNVFRHIKSGGMYKLLHDTAKLESTLTPVVVYQNFKTYEIWVRSKKEFFDGRFEAITNDKEFEFSSHRHPSQKS
jgi:hypothetical protein